ncbi:hypothetical protein [Mycobacterium sp. E342]|uniref:hypothetical protein n=1 Tax=Mycobacterium sp. E342 TaxID=1834147 RepID=UPI0018D4BE23|nr:hypothetical protein [Mycobacterium sp. E342]
MKHLITCKVGGLLAITAVLTNAACSHHAPTPPPQTTVAPTTTSTTTPTPQTTTPTTTVPPGPHSAAADIDLPPGSVLTKTVNNVDKAGQPMTQEFYSYTVPYDVAVDFVGKQLSKNLSPNGWYKGKLRPCHGRVAPNPALVPPPWHNENLTEWRWADDNRALTVDVSNPESKIIKQPTISINDLTLSATGSCL